MGVPYSDKLNSSLILFSHSQEVQRFKVPLKIGDFKEYLALASKPATASMVNKGQQAAQDREAFRRAGVRYVGTAASSTTMQSCETIMWMARKTGD